MNVIRRNVTSNDEHHGDVTVRRYYEDGVFLRADIYVGGWRNTIVKTEGGIRRAVARLTLKKEGDGPTPM